MGNNYGGDDRIVMVAPADIVAAAAEKLTNPATSHNARYVASDDRTATKIAHGRSSPGPSSAMSKPKPAWKRAVCRLNLPPASLNWGPAFTARFCGKTMTGTSPPVCWVRLSRKTLPGNLPLASSKDDFLRLKGAASEGQLEKPGMGAQGTEKRPLFERARLWPRACCPAYSVAGPGSEPRGKRHKSQRLHQPTKHRRLLGAPWKHAGPYCCSTLAPISKPSSITNRSPSCRKMVRLSMWMRRL